MDTAGSPNWQFQTSDGYAIPINRAMAIVQQIDAGRQSDTVHVGKTAFIGISATTVQGGVEIQDVVSGSAAESAGLQRGHIITMLGGTPVASLADLRARLFQLHPGDVVTLTYVDAFEATQSVELTLGEGPPQ
jgi:S1-C subfamily serine protease